MRLTLTKAEMIEWAQEAIDKRFKTSPGKVTNVEATNRSGVGTVGFEVAVEPGSDTAAIAPKPT